MTVRVNAGIAAIRLTDNVAETFQVAITNNASLDNPPNDSINVLPASPTLVLEAESGTLTAPMALRNDSQASGAQYVEVPQGSGNNQNDATAGGPGQVEFAVTSRRPAHVEWLLGGGIWNDNGRWNDAVGWED